MSCERCGGLGYEDDQTNVPCQECRGIGSTDPQELTPAELTRLVAGERLHFTNWPGRPSVPVEVTASGSVQTADGYEVYAMADELSRYPRDGLGGKRTA